MCFDCLGFGFGFGFLSWGVEGWGMGGWVGLEMSGWVGDEWMGLSGCGCMLDGISWLVWNSFGVSFAFMTGASRF